MSIADRADLRGSGGCRGWGGGAPRDEAAAWVGGHPPLSLRPLGPVHAGDPREKAGDVAGSAVSTEPTAQGLQGAQMGQEPREGRALPTVTQHRGRASGPGSS